jgi:hypothetical protein
MRLAMKGVSQETVCITKKKETINFTISYTYPNPPLLPHSPTSSVHSSMKAKNIAKNIKTGLTGS